MVSESCEEDATNVNIETQVQWFTSHVRRLVNSVMEPG